ADDGAKAKVEQRPGRVLSRRAAAEVVPRDENRCAAPAREWRVERKLRSRPPLLVQPPVGKEMCAETAAVDCLEKARRNDLVGIDVFSGQHDAARCERREWLHHLRAHERLRTSAIAPVTAVAAA